MTAGMLTITRRLEIDAGHRLLQHESKCRSLHGHRYRFDITITGSQGTMLDKVGRIIDFGVVRALVGGWLDHTWDHALLLEEGDPLIELLQKNDPATRICIVPGPPSIENMVQWVLSAAADLLAEHDIRVVQVVGYETPNCYATAQA